MRRFGALTTPQYLQDSSESVGGDSFET